MNTFIMTQGIYLVIFIVGMIAFYFIFIKPTQTPETQRKEKNKKIENDGYDFEVSDTFANIPTTSMKTSNKILKYFGGSYCPHSREGSRAYELIKNFETEYPGVKVEYYWTGGNDNDEFNKADAKYVPTVTNGSYNKVQLSVNEMDDTSNKSDEELKNLVMINIYKQL